MGDRGGKKDKEKSKPRRRAHFRAVAAIAGALLAALWVSATLVGQSGGSGAKGETEWRFFGGDAGAARYSPANAINAGNVRDLRVAWRWSARNFGPRPAPQMQVSPLIVDGVMYTAAGVNRDVVALDAATGQQLWHWRPTGELLRWFDIIERLARSSGRGVTYWTDGAGDERIFVVMNSFMLVALDAKTGRPVAGFGKDGVVDMTEHLRWNERPGLPREGRVANTSPSAIVGNVLVASISLHTGSTPNLPGAAINEQWPMNIPGDVLAFDTKTGKMWWRFNVIPRPGEAGADTWLKADPKVWEVPGGLNAWAKDRPDLRESSNLYTGNAGFWAPVTADPELGMFYVATESPTSDYYGGYRPGNNLYANSLLALDAKTGRRVWHFQLTHHDIWDYDPPTAPILADITVEGRPVKAVVQLTKQAFAFVFDRATGKPVWPIEERPVPKSGVPGEWTSPTQPFPTRPVALDVQGVTENDLVDFTPEIKAEALRIARQFRLGPLYAPPSVADAADGTMGTLTAPSAGGGVNWPGIASPGERRMPFYLTRFSYTPETWARLVRNPEDRRAAAQQYIESVGGTLHGFWYAFGDHDAYTLWEAPDNQSMAATAFAISAGGALSSLHTTVLLTVEETLSALQKARSIGYRPPGKDA